MNQVRSSRVIIETVVRWKSIRIGCTVAAHRNSRDQSLKRKRARQAEKRHNAQDRLSVLAPCSAGIFPPSGDAAILLPTPYRLNCESQPFSFPFACYTPKWLSFGSLIIPTTLSFIVAMSRLSMIFRIVNLHVYLSLSFTLTSQVTIYVQIF